MARPLLLLTHSPFVGPGSWRRVGERLRDAGWPVAVADLRPALTGAPPLHDALVTRAVGAAGAADAVVLVPHSNAGRLSGAIAARLDRRCAGAVLVDALLPAPGTSFIERAPPEVVTPLLKRADDRGFLPSWPRWWPEDVLIGELPDAVLRAELLGEAAPVPVAYLRELAPPGELPARCGYLRLSKGYDDVAEELAGRGAPVVRRALGHLAAMTHPDAVSGDVLRLLAALGYE